jgi:glycosyltransferase involved in cell wall biosynthesis
VVDVFELDARYSTSRHVTRISPETIDFATGLILPVGEGRQGEGGLRTQGYFKRDLPNKPLITIVTVVFNGEAYLEESILSVINQTYDNVEYVVIDGASSDGTLDIIKKYEGAIDYWVSERDIGIFDAMNKGIKVAGGLFIGFVNADDYFYSNTVSNLTSGLAEREFDYTFGSVDMIKTNGEYIETFCPILKAELNRFKGEYISMPSPHQAIFIKRKILNELGGFDLQFKLAADYDLILRVMAISKSVWYFQDIVGCFRQGGVSGSYDTFLEVYILLKKHQIGFFRRGIVTIESLIKVFISKSLPIRLVNFLRAVKPSGRFRKFSRQ